MKKRAMGRILAICMAAMVMTGMTACGENPGKGTDIQDEVLVASESAETEESAEESKAAENKVSENKKESRTESKPSESKTENKNAESKAVESKTSESKAQTESKASENETESKTSESKVQTESKVSESKAQNESEGQTESNPASESKTQTESNPTSESKTQTENKTESAPASESEAPQAPQAPKHEHFWNETGRTSSTDCFAGKTTTTISYSCSCGETKTDTSTADSGCVWEWVGETTYDNSGCIKNTISRHICTVHGTATSEMPKMETVDEHNYVESRTEPTCECEGFVTVTCSKCGTHFPEKSYSLGGGQGHSFAESSRRPLSEDEASWYEGKSSCVTYTCSTCGFSYDEIE